MSPSVRWEWWLSIYFKTQEIVRSKWGDEEGAQQRGRETKMDWGGRGAPCHSPPHPESTCEATESQLPSWSWGQGSSGDSWVHLESVEGRDLLFPTSHWGGALYTRDAAKDGQKWDSSMYLVMSATDSCGNMETVWGGLSQVRRVCNLSRDRNPGVLDSDILLGFQ